MGAEYASMRRGAIKTAEAMIRIGAALTASSPEKL
jgi:hypothetical protein